jgi:hypothetical protein
MVVSGTVATTYIPLSQVRAVMVRSRGVFGSGIYRDERGEAENPSQNHRHPSYTHCTLSNTII